MGGARDPILDLPDGGTAGPYRLGVTYFSDGAALDLTTNTWTEVADSPFPHGLYQPIGAWDGTEVIIVGTDCDAVVPLTTDGSPPPCRPPTT